MNEYISILQGYIAHLEYMKKNADELFDREQADRDIEAFKAAIKALERSKIGHWITYKALTGEVLSHRCDLCKYEIFHQPKTNYCPNCGAKMEDEA